MLPTLPFVPHAFLRGTSRLVAITGCQADSVRRLRADSVRRRRTDWMLAVHDLEGPAAGGWTVTDGLGPRGSVPPSPKCFAISEGEGLYRGWSELLFISREQGESLATGTLGRFTLDMPEFLDLDWLQPSSYAVNKAAMCLVAHRGSVFLVAELEQKGLGPALSCGIWRLVRSRTDWAALAGWEAVAGLKMEQMYRWIRPKHADVKWPRLFDAWGAGDLLCVGFTLDRLGFAFEPSLRSADSLLILVGFSLETGTWEPHYDNRRHLMVHAKPFELRPHSFLLPRLAGTRE